MALHCNAMKRQGFDNHFINLVYQCISTTNLAVIINGEPSASFHPQRGIRQGCPLSPYLFVLAVNELSITLQNNMEHNNINGVMLGPNCPRIHSLLFADDLIICGQANATKANKINSILQTFCNASGQTPNLAEILTIKVKMRLVLLFLLMTLPLTLLIWVIHSFSITVIGTRLTILFSPSSELN
jgi:hypothetical protein